MNSKQYRPDLTTWAANEPLLPLSVHGAGFVGLVTAACFAELGHVVLCMETDVARVAQLARGQLPFIEPGLEDLLVRNSRRGRLRFTNDAEAAVAHGAVQFIAIDAAGQRDGAADLRPLLDAARRIGAGLQREALIVCRGAAPVGTTQQLRQAVHGELARRGLRDLRFTVAANPDFLAPGIAVERFMQPARVVVGADDARSIELLRGLYAPVIRRPEQWLALAPRSAELASYASTALQAAQAAVMNELAHLAEALQLDIEEVRGGMAAEAFGGPALPAPGSGPGAAGVPRALRGLQRLAQDHGVALPTVSAAEQTHQRQRGLLARRAIEWFGGSLAGRRVALWGLSVARGSDELREGPGEMLVSMLLSAGARVVAHDPVAMPAARRQQGHLRGLSFASSPIDAVYNADALLIATDWPEYRAIDWPLVHGRMATPLVLDGRNVCDPAHMAALGFSYRGVGRSQFEKFAAIPSAGSIRSREPAQRAALPTPPPSVINVVSRA